MNSKFIITRQKVKKCHWFQYCVKKKAAQSLMLSRNLDFDVALMIVLRVFDKCYNDLEPVGRRIRRNSMDPEMAYNEAISLGFCDK